MVQGRLRSLGEAFGVHCRKHYVVLYNTGPAANDSQGGDVLEGSGDSRRGDGKTDRDGTKTGLTKLSQLRELEWCHSAWYDGATQPGTF